MLRSIGKQSGESMQSVLKKKMRLRWEGFTEKEGLQPGIKVRGGDGILIIKSILVSSITTVHGSCVLSTIWGIKIVSTFVAIVPTIIISPEW